MKLTYESQTNNVSQPVMPVYNPNITYVCRNCGKQLERASSICECGGLPTSERPAEYYRNKMYHPGADQYPTTLSIFLAIFFSPLTLLFGIILYLTTKRPMYAKLISFSLMVIGCICVIAAIAFFFKALM